MSFDFEHVHREVMPDCGGYAGVSWSEPSIRSSVSLREALPPPPTVSALQAAAKRAFDFTAALAGLIIVLPFLILLSIALQIDSPGKLFFIQQRVGRGGRMFPCIKFRTMRSDAAQVLADLLANDPAAQAEWREFHKLKNDPRVTRLGLLVRKLSLDELPQLVNILIGQMSVVGPRPIVKAEIEKYGQYFSDYCALKPGLTGLWQVSGRNDVSYPERVQMDCDYRRRRNFAFDLKIIFLTVPAVLMTKGSY
jgi:exopolysaccharide production protein ExoY